MTHDRQQRRCELLFIATLSFGSSALSTSCSSNSSTAADGGAESATGDSGHHDGGGGGKIIDVPPSCNGKVFIPLPASDCSFLSCDGSSVVYALCVGHSYAQCDCSIPSGYSEVMGM